MQQTNFQYDIGKYFGAAARAGSWIASGVALLYLLSGVWAAVLLLPLGPLAIITKYFVAFDLEQQTYREGVRIGSITFGEKVPLPGFEFAFLKKNTYSQTFESRASMSVAHHEKYDGYLKLRNGKKLHLLQLSQKEPAVQQMQQVAHELGTEFRDLTEMQYS